MTDGKVIGSLLVAQPFTKDEYFQPRPSAASFDATASTSSGYAPSNYALRDRVARVIGPLATYADGPNKGKSVAPDVEAWFQADKAGGNPHIVGAVGRRAQQPRAGLGDRRPDPWRLRRRLGEDATTPRSRIGSRPIRQRRNRRLPTSRSSFFKSFSNEHPGMFPSSVTKTGADGKPVTDIEPVNAGSDIQSMFFDMWRSDHPDVALNDVPGDLVTASASGLDPHITLENAEFQLDRVAAKWADDKKRDVAEVRKEIEAILADKAFAPWGGAIGEKIVNVLEVNLELHKRYGDPA